MVQEIRLQATIIYINLNNIPLTILSTYFPQGQNIAENNIESCFHKLGNNFVFDDDLNDQHTAWDSSLINTRRKSFHILANSKIL